MKDSSGDSMQIVLVTQDLAQVGMFARQLVELTFHHTKLTHIGAAGSYRIDVYQGPMQGANPNRATRLREMFGRYDPAIFGLYFSHTLSEGDTAVVNEKPLDARGNIWKRPVIWLALAGCIAAVIWGVPALRGIVPKKKNAAPQVVTQESRSTFAKPKAVLGDVGELRAWRVSGELVVQGGESEVFVTSGPVTVRLAFDRYCVRTLDGWPLCTWEGQEVTPYSSAVYRAPQDPLGAAASPDSGDAGTVLAKPDRVPES